MGQDKNTMLTFLIFGILAIGLHIANGETPIRYTILQNGPHCNKPGAAVKNPECSWHYLAYTPRIFRGGVTEKVLFMTHNVNFDVVIEAKLVKAKGSNEIASSGKVIAKPGQLTELLLKVPVDAPSKGIVKIDGSATVPYGTNGLTNPAKWFFNNQTKEIEIKKTSTSVFIQSDRPIYKPGETIQMRIVAVDSNLKAVKGKVSKVSVLNPSQTLMRQWSDVKLKGGIASLKLKLTIKPVLGVWRIKAVVNGIYKTIQVKVEKYVLPKFQVQIKPPPFIALGSLKADGEICAKYSYGKNVNGLLKAKICARHPAHWNRGWQKERAICEDIKRSIFGCTPFEIDLRYFKVYEYTGWSSIKFTIQASVEEKATGIALNATKKELKVHKSPVKLSFEGTPDIFKPGLPFNAEVRATSPDGSPADNIKVNVVVRGGYRKTLFSGDVTVRNGRGKIDVKEIPFDVKEVSFDATYRRPKISGSKVSDYKRRSSAYHNAKAWYSPSHSYLGIIKPRTILKVGSAARIKVRYTTVDQNPTNRTVYYSLMCKGYATHSGSIVTEFIGANSRIKRSVEDVPPTTAEIPRTTAEQTNPEPTKPDRTEPEPTLPDSPEEPTLVTVIPTTTPEPTTTASEIEDTYVPWWRRKTATRPPLPERFSSGSFDIKFRVTQEMSPSCRMLVYYVRNAENVADSVVIDVEDSFANEVSMKFAKGEVFPGTKVKLSLKASPGSRFAISAVDKSVHFLANANDIKTNQVSGILKSLDIGPGHISEGERCGGERRWYWGYHSQSDFVDSQKAFNDGGLLFLSNTQIDTRPCKREYYDYYYREDLYATAMPRIFTTVAALPATEAYYIATTSPDTRAGGRPNIKKKFVPKPRPKPKVRSEFPETWLWTEETVDEKTGEKIMEVKVPDTITTWYASGFAISDQDGLGVAKPAEIRGFKAVFVSVNLPYSVIRGEMVTIPVVAFNYLDVCLNVRMSMKVTKDFKSRTRNYANVCLCAGKSATVMFKIIAQKLDRINIEATAESVPKNNCPSFVNFDPTSHIDIVRKKLLVEPEGIEEEYTWNSLVCPNDKTVAEKAKLEIPANVVPESVYSELRVIGDLMGPSLSNIDSLLKMPYGCGEQNMLNFAPNIFIMQYLKATNQLTEAIKDKATGYTLQGYQRELSYKHSDGSYSAFGDRDPEGSMWLTAFVLKSFAEARDFIEIDKKIMTEAKRWILRKQSRDGCFPTVGSLHNKAMKGGVKTPVTLTGYVVLSLLEAGMPPMNSHIARAINRCIVPQLKNINDTYSLTILSYTLMKAGRQQELNYLLRRLEKAAIKKDGTRHWEEQKPKDKKAAPISWWSPPYYQASSADIEMSAYALMALVPEDDKVAAVASVDIVKWLSQQRNSLGGWSSTQDTVLAMQALAKFAAIVHGGKLDMKVDVSVPGLAHQFIVNNENTLVLQRIQIPPNFPTVLKLHATGKGCALLSASVKYNVKDKQKEPSFALSVDLEPLKSNKKMTHGRCRSQRMNIRAKWLKDDTSNMAIISVKMLSGFEPTTDSLDKAVFRDPLLKEYEKKGKDWVFYYSRIKDVSLSFKVKQTRIVQNMKASSVTVYDYYDTDKSATVSYDVTKKMCA